MPRTGLRNTVQVALAQLPLDATTAEAAATAVMSALSLHYGGQSLYIPRGHSAAHTAARAKAMQAQGLAIEQIAMRLECSDRWVRKLLALPAGAGTRSRLVVVRPARHEPVSTAPLAPGGSD